MRACEQGCVIVIVLVSVLAQRNGYFILEVCSVLCSPLLLRVVRLFVRWLWSFVSVGVAFDKTWCVPFSHMCSIILGMVSLVRGVLLTWLSHVEVVSIFSHVEVCWCYSL